MGSTIDRKVEMLLSFDTPVGIAKSMGLGLIVPSATACWIACIFKLLAQPVRSLPEP